VSNIVSRNLKAF